MAVHPVFAEPVASPDPTTFATEHGSDNAVYAQVETLLKTQVVAFPKSRAVDDALFTLADAYGPTGEAVVDQIKQSGRLVFHSVGDTGASDVRRYQNEQRVADQITTDAHSSEVSNRPAFFFHLGDVVYNFGEARYYYDQFYEPYRAYPNPILAIPGNHDSFVIPGTQAGETPLDVFSRNFCSPVVAATTEAGSLHRTAMTQPGVYFAFDAPFIRILALFSNALEDPGTISSENGRWPGVPDYQLDFLRAQLQRIKKEQYVGAVVIATHHPPFVYSSPPSKPGAAGNHGSSSNMLRQVDQICSEIGVYPHAWLSAHAHCYQRFTRTLSFGGGERRVPFVVCGNGGHNVNPLVRATRDHAAPEPENGADVSYLEVKPAVKATRLQLDKYDDHDYGYLRISVDAKQLRIAYHQSNARSLLQSRYDLVTVDLASHTLLPNG
ncbi:MAG: metallophosphoesterase [Acetobacteraceae bacterium]|nr:metallophosphoesterase [Acetobacteraceae bacterium]